MWRYLIRSGNIFCLDHIIGLFGRFNVEVLFSGLLVVKGETLKSSLVEYPSFQDTASFTCYVNCF